MEGMILQPSCLRVSMGVLGVCFFRLMSWV